MSPQRASRPWQGQVEKVGLDSLPAYDPKCYLCPGNSRAGGEVNPLYSSTYVFKNDFPALLDTGTENQEPEAGFFRASPVRGTCRVICYSARHDLTLPLMSAAEFSAVIGAWCAQTAELGLKYAWVQLFQNQGEMMGASNPHPHGQVWALDDIPNEPLKEDIQQRTYFSSTEKILLLEYLNAELALRQRVVTQTAQWVVLVPFWAIWPFETLVLPKRHVLHLQDLTEEERLDLARVLKELTTRYDNLFESPFPYSMGWHEAPHRQGDNSHWQLHAHFFPPLLRSASIRKFMVGYELLAEAQRDLTAEQAAQRLRNLPPIHYSQK